jgi:methylenetetrahydrofolate reductase (NADPH)
MKIIDAIEKCKEDGLSPFLSLEFFPPKTEEALYNLKNRMERLCQSLGPLFIDMTWGAGGSTFNESLELSTWAEKYTGCEVMMHLTLTNISLESIDLALSKAKEAGIQNILALRGDPPKGQDRWSHSLESFRYATDLVRYIKEKYEGYFGVCVAGYPEGHTECESLEQDLIHLKEKIDAGADFIITQLFYDTNAYFEYVRKCREAGIRCPIIPGIMPIQSYQGFHRMVNMCRVAVPQNILEKLEEIKDDDDQVKLFGVEVALDMCEKLLAGGVPGLHFYTLNLERSVTKVVERLKISKLGREAPWLRPANRVEEWVRPINWSKRPKSYIERTTNWDDYPNGRWSDSRSPSFGFSFVSGRGLYSAKQKENLSKIWGKPTDLKGVSEIFTNFLNGTITRLPWFEEQSLQDETAMIKDFLISLNQFGLFTINSQPKVNCARASDSKVGWGPRGNLKGGYVYQREYVEFFCSKEALGVIVESLQDYSTISYVAVNKAGDSISNIGEGEVVAMTWGIFPNREVIQPTILDPYIFKTWWREEAFTVWMAEWAEVYPKDSESFKLLEFISNNFYLVNVLENDFVDGSLEAAFEKVLNKLVKV